MKKVLENPIMVNLELNLIGDIVKIIGNAIHTKFSHDEVSSLLDFIKNRGQEAFDASKQEKNSTPEQCYELS